MRSPIAATIAPIVELQPARSVSSASLLKLTADQVLDAQRLTVLGILLALGLTAGLSLGFGIGGWWGVGAGLVAGFGMPYALAVAFRREHTRRWLALLADWATERPNLRRKDARPLDVIERD
jgi:hypothetical protein